MDQPDQVDPEDRLVSGVSKVYLAPQALLAVLDHQGLLDHVGKQALEEKQGLLEIQADKVQSFYHDTTKKIYVL